MVMLITTVWLSQDTALSEKKKEKVKRKVFSVHYGACMVVDGGKE